MCHTPISQDPENTVPMEDTAALMALIGPMVRKHAAIRNEGVEPGGYATFNAGRDLSFMVRLNTAGLYDVTAIRNHGAPVSHYCDLHRDGLGLAILTTCDRS